MYQEVTQCAASAAQQQGAGGQTRFLHVIRKKKYNYNSSSSFTTQEGVRASLFKKREREKERKRGSTPAAVAADRCTSNCSLVSETYNILVAALAAAVLAALGPRLLHLGFLAHLKILSEGVFEYFAGA